MNTCLYKCTVYHSRTHKAKNSFTYKIFNWAVDIDETGQLNRFFPLLAYNRRSIFSFKDKDHFFFDTSGLSLRQKVEKQLNIAGIKDIPHKIVLITNLRVFGYVFNPVSFYFCSQKNGAPLALLAEVNNTFGEQKPYVVSLLPEKKRYVTRTPKNFYVSPYIDYDTDFEFEFTIPGEKLNIKIDTKRGGMTELHARITGERKTLTTPRMLGYLLLFPLVTLKIIAAIHWQALKLFVKKVPFYKKDQYDKRLNEHLKNIDHAIHPE